MTNLFLLLKGDYSLSKSYEIPTGDRTINYITVELEENSDIASHISDYTFTLIIKLPSGKKAAYALTPDEDNKFEKLAVPTAFSFFGEDTKVFIDIYNDSELVAQSDELSYVLQNVDKVVPTLLITENGIYDVTKYDKVNCDVIDPVNELNDGFEKTLVGSESESYVAQDTLSQNIVQAENDFQSIKTSIESKGVQIPSGTHTSEYSQLIADIPAGDTEQVKKLIQGDQAPFDIPNGVTQIRNNMFYKSNITSLTIPDSVTIIGDTSIAQCTHLESLVLPSSIIQVSSYGISANFALRTVSILSTSCTFVYGTFSACTQLQNVTIANNFDGNGLNLSASTQYSADTILGWLNALADRTGDTARTLTIGSTNLNKLTAEQIAIATNKNWNLA